MLWNLSPRTKVRLPVVLLEVVLDSPSGRVSLWPGQTASETQHARVMGQSGPERCLGLKTELEGPLLLLGRGEQCVWCVVDSHPGNAQSFLAGEAVSGAMRRYDWRTGVDAVGRASGRVSPCSSRHHRAGPPPTGNTRTPFQIRRPVPVPLGPATLRQLSLLPEGHLLHGLTNREWKELTQRSTGRRPHAGRAAQAGSLGMPRPAETFAPTARR